MTEKENQNVPQFAISWRRRTVKPRARKNRETPEWEWHLWRTEVAGVRFQYGKLSATVWDLNGADPHTAPDRRPNSVWQIWSDFGTETELEFMGYLFPKSENPEAIRDEANRKVSAFMRYRKQELARRIREIESQAVDKQLLLI